MGPQPFTVLASAERTATHSTADFITPGGMKGLRLRISVTAATSTPSVVFTIQEKHTLSAEYGTLLESAAVTSTGLKTTLVIYPGCVAVANAVLNQPLSSVWRLTCTHADTDAITYSVDADYIP